MTPCALHYEAAGAFDMPALLLGGSLGTTLAMWDPQIAALAAHRRVVRFDHRGHGRSPVPPGPYAIEQLGRDVLALLDRLGIERADYCGLSLGGMVGMWLAAHAPRRVGRLVLVCTSAHMPPAAAWRERAAIVRGAGSVEAVAEAVLARWLTPAYAAAHPEAAEHLRAMLAATPAEGYAGCCEAIAALDLRPVLSHIVARTLVIVGAEDPAAPPAAHAEPIAAAIPHARLELVSSAAHLASVERPDVVTQLIAAHLDLPEAP